MAPPRRRLPAKALEAAGFDLWLLAPVLLLCGVGLIMVLSASSVLAENCYQDAYYFFKKQCLSLGLGLGLMALARFVKTSVLAVLVYPILFVCLGLLVMVLLPGVGSTVGGATSWLRYGSFSLQPSELAKIGLCLYLAYSMAKKQDNMGRWSIGLAPHLIVAGAMIGLTVLQRDLGMSAILCLLLVSILFLGGARLRHLLGLTAGAAASGAVMVLLAPYRVQRLVTFADPWVDPAGSSFQIIHSFLAFGSGGLFGTGLGQSHQKLGYLPEPHTDFIFAILGEEIGFLGILGVVTLFLLLAVRGFHWAAKAQDPYRRYLASGLTLVIVVQALVNMAVVLGLLPTTGVTLPFISYGGSSLVANLIAAGILLRLSVELKAS
ncbi:MAG: putative lipid II flippase FtsW [Deltaproteobacteria bacterium]|nr:putative lipid II flippase FtsW [Deltaproteobacteria bacterium]